ncbi:SigE family RNA polymerase sigma factor [Actinomadura harenae]|uniref:SigE family RNA polymerase sigma factor n=1 Tax=Actinomadura harenae TaxID=2483351 RepID=A0A3M2LH34_9ACTN|nr:SigE family RNA polymerase sigma factor [Actinomadura harenae]
MEGAGRAEAEGGGEPDVAEEWVAARLPALQRYAYLLTGSAHDAEDVVQTALARTLAAWPRVTRKHDPEPYVRKAIARLVLNSRRRAWRERLWASPPERAEQPSWPGDRVVMWTALATLPPRQRAVVVLRYYEDLSEAQIAETLGCSPGTVKSQSAKALAKLKRYFESERAAR